MKKTIPFSILLLFIMASCVSLKMDAFTGDSGYVVYSSNVNQVTSSENIYVKDLATGSIKQLTDAGNNQYPGWSPDGSKIIFESFTKETLYDISIMDKDGGNKTLLLHTSANERQADFSSDGKELVFVSDQDGNDEIYKINLETSSVTRLSNSALDEAFPKWSPSGNRIVFVSIVDGGRTQIYTMDTNGENIQELTGFTLEGFDRDPVWCPDESCIIFTRLSTPDRLMRLDTETGEITYLLEDDSFECKNQGFPVRSPSSEWITFYCLDSKESYAINMKSTEIVPLGVNATSLMLYP